MYEVQLNAYGFIAEKGDLFRPVSRLTLIYMEPVTDISLTGNPRKWGQLGFHMGFSAQILEVAVDFGKIPPLLSKLRDIYDIGEPPVRRFGCHDCFLFDQLIRTAAA
jgi:hypothetical protein